MAGVTTDTYTYPLTSNRLGSISLAAGGTRAFTYDAAGNVVSDNRGAGFGYTYDAAGRLSELRINGVLQAQYRYDFAGRQAVRTLHLCFSFRRRRSWFAALQNGLILIREGPAEASGYRGSAVPPQMAAIRFVSTHQQETAKKLNSGILARHYM
jgi:YD repeat-containing protein